MQTPLPSLDEGRDGASGSRDRRRAASLVARPAAIRNAYQARSSSRKRACEYSPSGPMLRATAMVSRLEKLEVNSPIESLLPLFEAGHVAIVMDGERFLGLITRIDLLNFLRRRAQ